MTRLPFLLLTLFLPLSTAALAANHALLIGIGEYQLRYFDGAAGQHETALPGIDKDITLMRSTVERLGYKPDEITVLENSQASLSGIRQALAHLAQRAAKGDRVLIYYSGHGAQVPDRAPLDEEDGLDEALVAWDFRPGRETLENVLTDDEIATALGRIRAENLLVIFDSCHSGTADRAFALKGRIKGGPSRFKSKRLPAEWVVQRGKSVGGEGISDGAHVALMASQEDETANATSNGSVLTIAVHAAVKEATERHAPVTAVQLHALADAVAQRFAANMAKQGEQVNQHPQLRGPVEKQDWNLRKVDNVFAMVSEWADSVPDRLMLRTNQAQYRVGVTLEITLPYAPIAGHLNLIQVGTETQIIRVLFPNNFSKRGNLVEAGETLHLPAPEGGFALPASLPDGATRERVVLIAVISTEPKDWHTASPEDRLAAFRQLAPHEERDFAPVAVAPTTPTNKGTLYVGKVIVEVVR